MTARHGRRLLAACVLAFAAAATQVSAAPAPSALAEGWAGYKARFVMPEGRVVDDLGGGASHSEGQGFGMLLAESAGDVVGFARLWAWTERELYLRPDGLAAWRWVPDHVPHVADPNNATDGDLLIAWALLRAADRWNSPEYRGAARRIALAIGRAATFESTLGPALKPAAAGFDAAAMADGPVVNLSYWVFPALDAMPEVAPEVDWAGIARTGRTIVAEARFGPARLPSDWISLAGAPAPAKGFPPLFGYDAVRIPLYLAWAGAGTPDLYAPFLRLVRGGAVPSTVDLPTGLSGDPFGEAGYRAVFSLAACAAGAGDARDPLVPPRSGPGDHYYPSSLQLLSVLAARDRALPCD